MLVTIDKTIDNNIIRDIAHFTDELCKDKNIKLLKVSESTDYEEFEDKGHIEVTIYKYVFNGKHEYHIRHYGDFYMLDKGFDVSPEIILADYFATRHIGAIAAFMLSKTTLELFTGEMIVKDIL